MRIYTGENLKNLKNMANPFAGPTAFLNIRECILEINSIFVINEERFSSKIHTSENPTEFTL